MNGNDMNRFDAAVRAHHDAAVDGISPRVRAQLAQRRNAALRGEGVRRGHGLRYAAAGFAALGALAIGLRFGNPLLQADPAMPPGGAIATASTNVGSTMLDEDPEFYAWLASSDAKLVAME